MPAGPTSSSSSVLESSSTTQSSTSHQNVANRRGSAQSTTSSEIRHAMRPSYRSPRKETSAAGEAQRQVAIGLPQQLRLAALLLGVPPRDVDAQRDQRPRRDVRVRDVDRPVVYPARDDVTDEHPDLHTKLVDRCTKLVRQVPVLVVRHPPGG